MVKGSIIYRLAHASKITKRILAEILAVNVFLTQSVYAIPADGYAESGFKGAEQVHSRLLVSSSTRLQFTQHSSAQHTAKSSDAAKDYDDTAYDIDVSDIDISDESDLEEQDFEDDETSIEPGDLQPEESLPAQPDESQSQSIEQDSLPSHQAASGELESAKEPLSPACMHIGIFASPGLEKLAVQGGSSEYDDKSQFLGIDLHASAKLPIWDGFSTHLRIHSHEFVNKNQERRRADSQAAPVKNRSISLFNLSLNVQKRVFTFAAHHELSLVIGMGASQRPTLATDSAALGSAKLASFYYRSLSTGLSYQWALSERGRLHMDIDLLVRSDNPEKNITRGAIMGSIKYNLTGRLFLISSLHWLREVATYRVSCPPDQNSCTTAGRYESQVTYAQLGAGFDF